MPLVGTVSLNVIDSAAYKAEFGWLAASAIVETNTVHTWSRHLENQRSQRRIEGYIAGRQYIPSFDVEKSRESAEGERGEVSVF